MKIILGDNQFFGINHFDLEKGVQTKSKFSDLESIRSFISDSLELGMDGFMINSNDMGYKLISGHSFEGSKEIHYSIPYPHKYASMVNENGMMSLFSFVFKNTSFVSNVKGGLKLVSTKNLVHLTPLALDIEVPNALAKGSYIYLQNIITDLLIGMKRFDILEKFVRSCISKGYRPGLITLNPVILDCELRKFERYLLEELIVCFNINAEGFNVFPSLSKVENYIKEEHIYQLMGMSIFASGAASISKSIQYIKKLNLDYVVFGTSRIENVKANLELLKM